MGEERKTAEDYLTPGKRHPVDEKDAPRWAKGPDGRYVDISPTWDNACGAEFAWELRAVCGLCHERLHEAAK